MTPVTFFNLSKLMRKKKDSDCSRRNDEFAKLKARYINKFLLGLQCNAIFTRSSSVYQEMNNLLSDPPIFSSVAVIYQKLWLYIHQIMCLIVAKLKLQTDEAGYFSKICTWICRFSIFLSIWSPWNCLFARKIRGFYLHIKKFTISWQSRNLPKNVARKASP